MSRLILHAPNVHVGGGLVLLKALLAATNLPPIIGNFDSRAEKLLQLPAGSFCTFTGPSLRGRFAAERRLAKLTRPDDIVLCFHGLPPFFRVNGRVIVYQQNRNYLGLSALSEFSGRSRIRIGLERILCKALRRNVDEYIVQTESMRRAVVEWHGGVPIVDVFPFLPIQESFAAAQDVVVEKFDFIYVADGEAHKNHRNLIKAWGLLAETNLFPSLALTLPDSCSQILKEMQDQKQRVGVRIVNLGRMSHAKTLLQYRSTRALVFPSKSESFGLPLIEAKAAGLAIVASELDYVRDVCVPAETFDPTSPRSIAAAIRRFMQFAEPIAPVYTSDEFITKITS